MSIAYSEQLLPIEKVFRDPVHSYIHVQHQVILDLINSAEVQRLRRIKQLGTSSFTFHGAEHSRFAHSLGVYEISRRICDIFQRNYSKKQLGEDGWDDDERLITLCAALLHDIGHGPYSHTFEHIFQTNHEQFTIDIITSPKTEVHQILSRISSDFPEKVASVITKTYPNPQVVQMISSQIDADRMDYLLRDAYFTGAEYGTFDLTRVLSVIRPYKCGIAFSMNGMHAVEDYIVSRYQMYVQVYFHPTSRGMEVLLDHLLHRAQELFIEYPEEYSFQAQLLLPFFKNDYTLADYLKLDDNILSAYFTQWLDLPDVILSDLAKRFLMRKPLKSATFMMKKDGKTIHYLKKLIEKTGYNTLYYTAINSSYDLPYDFYRPEKGSQRTQIEIMQKDGTLIELSKISNLVAALAGQTQGDNRFYFPKEMLGSKHDSLFNSIHYEFTTYIHNGAIQKKD